MNEARPARTFRRNLAVFLGGGAVLVLIGAGAFYCWMFGGLGDLCGNEIISSDVAPNGALKAVLFRRDCGATTGYSTQVSILSASRSLPNEAGNIFIQKDEPVVVIRWIDDHHLSVSGGGARTAFRHLTDYRGVRITYD